MKVKNQKCIWRLSRKSLWAYRKRNLIAIIAIALTALLFTSLFTIVFSINSSYETFQFRQVGGYNHGTFKDVTDEQLAAISAHPNVKATGARTTIGIALSGVFAKEYAEVSYMDKNCTKWSYAEPTTGRAPQSGKEIAMDTRALELLNVTPELGAEINLTYNMSDKNQAGPEISDTFTLVGYWEYDNLMPTHYLNISKEYAEEIEAKGLSLGLDSFRTDLNVMMASSIDIRGQMEQVDTDLGYTWETRNEENSVRIGVNWGYTSSQIGEVFDLQTVAAALAFIILVIFTGYLIIYNIFQISVTGDIRFYGLLKTIGVTPRQLRRIIRQQALLLCLFGIPTGLLLGYGVGVVLTPIILQSTTLGTTSLTISASPVIFAGSAAFALITVFLSCSKPGRIASGVSPVEASKYTEAMPKGGKKSRAARGAGLANMAFGNLGRNKVKTGLVVMSLALSVVLLNILCTFVGGFDMDTYLSRQTCADFIVSGSDYFHYNSRADTYISEEAIQQITEHTSQTTSGSGYRMTYVPNTYMSEEAWMMDASSYVGRDMALQTLANTERRGALVAQTIQIEGLDRPLFDKLGIVEGSLAPLLEGDSHTIAVCVNVDDYGNIELPDFYPSVGDTLTVTYPDEMIMIDTRTGEPCTDDTPEEYLDNKLTKSHDVDYTICALVTIPYSMSFRYHTPGYRAVLPVEVMRGDSGQNVVPLYYLFDTPDAVTEQTAEDWLASLTSDSSSTLMYESKETVRADFRQFQSMFLLLGGVLCAIVALVGILNFFNAIMTGIIARLREFAVLQAVGMTNRQLKTMLIYEGMLYAIGVVITSLVLSLILSPLAGAMLENTFWFFSAHFTLLPVLLVVPFFILLGWLIPTMLYGQTTKHSIVERLREAE